MKSNELFEQIHTGWIKDNTEIEVKTEQGEHIAFITYKDKKLNWKSGEFDTKYLCDIDTEFEIVDKGIKKLNLDGMLTGEKIKTVAEKVNEIIDILNKENTEDKEEKWVAPF